MFYYAQVDFDDVTYDVGAGPEWSRESWTSVKPSMPHAYPNLPYLIDGDFTLTETAAIMKYIARKWKPELLGTTPEEFATAEMMSYHVGTVKGLATMPCYQTKDGDRDAILTPIWPHLDKIVQFIGEHKWIAGDNLTWLDFAFWELIDYINFIAKGTLFDKYPTLAPYHQRFLELPGFSEAWKDDEKLMKYPYNNAMAAIGGRDSKY